MGQNEWVLQEDVSGSLVEKAVSIAGIGESAVSEDAETDPDDSDEDAHRIDVISSASPGGNGTGPPGDPPPAFRTQEQESDSEVPKKTAPPAFQTVDLQPDQQ
jgi:hypothetical protein